MSETSDQHETDGLPDASDAPAADERALDASLAEVAPNAPDEPPVRADEPPADTLFARGNRLRWTRGGITTLASSFMLFLLMAHDGQLRAGVPVGLVLAAIAAFGVMDIAGSFDDARTDDVKSTTPLAAVTTPLSTLIVALVLFGLSLAGAQSGVGHQWHWSIIVTVAFVGLVASVFDAGVKLGPWATDETGAPRALWHRHGFWIVTLAGVLYLPTLGSYSLWDPWETHYGEVAREILARNDWISLWWAQDGWFWSKPILNFWMQALAMASLGTHFQPDQMLIGAGGLANAHPEWVVRAPNFLLTVIAMYLFYKGVARVFGRRAGLLAGAVLATMPDWFFLAHQTMTDMPFVAPMTGAMGLLLLGLNTEPDAQLKLYEVNVGATRLRLSAWHLVFGTVLICAIPEIVYLLSRNLELVLHGNGAHGFRAHWDEFRSGSGMGNCGNPGNEACTLTNPASIPKAAGVHPENVKGIVLRLFGGFEPVVQALMWTALVVGLLYMNWGERRRQRMYFLAAWFFAAIATMGKGPAGFALPMICGFAYVGTRRRWSDLLRFELVSGIAIIGVVALPWFVAMYVRHGSPFTDRLIFHDMFNRAFSHVHDTNEGDDTSFRFYVWQLGYAVFPWTGLAPLGLVYWLRQGEGRGRARSDASVFFVMWFVFAFALFSFMGTKFHHYIFPAVPPVAALIGVVLSDILDGKRLWRGVGWLPLFVAGAGLSMIGVELLTAWIGGSAWGDKVTHWGSFDKQVLGAGIGLVIAAIVARFAIVRVSSLADDAPAEAGGPPDASRSHEGLMIGAAALASVMVIAIVGRDLAIKPDNADQPGAIRLLQLFTYNYRRTWPDSLDFGAVITAFVLIACALGLLLTVRVARRYAVVAMLSLAFVWAAWGVDVYMVRTAPHWGQHELIQAYYDNRKGSDEPLVAYQMNWKGENFYTSNKVPAFVSSGATFTTWVKSQREKGTKVVFFVTEHSRTGGLRSEVAGKNYRELTDKELCNKFVLIRAEL